MAIPVFDPPESGLDDLRKRLIEIWKRTVLQWFPDMHLQPIFIPPVFFNRVTYDHYLIDEDTVVHVPKPATQLSDVREDESMSRIYHLLALLFTSPKEPVLVLFGLDFDNYLNSATTTAEAGDRMTPSPEQERFSPKVRSQGRPLLKKTSFVPYLLKTTTGKKASPSSSPEPGMPTRGLGGRFTPMAAGQFLQASSHAKERTFPFGRPRDLDSAHQRGRFDILIVHKRRGIVVCEVKAIGDAFLLSKDGAALSFQLEAVRSRVRKSLKQLQKNVDVLRHLLTDLDPQEEIPIRTSLVFPNLKKQLFRAAVLQDAEAEKEFCNVLGARTADAALGKCLFSEQLPPMGLTGDITPDILEGLRSRWWGSLTNHPPCQTDFESLVARFCGPATKQLVPTAAGGRVDVTTLQQGVLETHRRCTAPVLSEEQLRTLEGDHRRVFITGPPGTGKTLMLSLKAKQFLAACQDVIVVSLWKGSTTISQALFKSLSDFGRIHGKLPKVITNIEDLFEFVQKMFNKRPEEDDSEILGWDDLEMDCESAPAPPPGSSLAGSAFEKEADFHFPGSSRDMREGKGYDFSPTPPATVLPTTAAPDPSRGGSQVFLLLDEAPWFLDSVVQQLDALLGQERDKKDQPQLVIWAASSFRAGRPASWPEVALSRPFRCPPAVVRELTRSCAYAWWARHPFPSPDAAVLAAVPHPTEGPAVKRVDHRAHGPPALARGGAVDDVWQCRKCGQEVALFLLRDLQICTSSEAAPSPADQQVLHLSDVLISGFVPKRRSADSGLAEAGGTFIQDDGPPSSGFLRGLEEAGVRCADLRRGRPEDVEELVQPTDRDRVQVARPAHVLGLERPVVVVLAAADVTATYPRLVDPWFDVMSRCTAQLLVVGDMKPSFL